VPTYDSPALSVQKGSLPQGTKVEIQDEKGGRFLVQPVDPGLKDMSGWLDRNQLRLEGPVDLSILLLLILAITGFIAVVLDATLPSEARRFLRSGGIGPLLQDVPGARRKRAGRVIEALGTGGLSLLMDDSQGGGRHIRPRSG
jgi:hypothetical protein